MKKTFVIITLFFLLTLSIGASHAATPWKMDGVFFEVCNCDIPCPCTTGGKPTNGFCRGIDNFHIDYGFYGDVSLNGINFTEVVDYPGDPMDGNATLATYISDNATPEQVEAIKAFVKEDMGALTAKDLGIKLVPIAFGRRFLDPATLDPSDMSAVTYDGMSGDTYTWVIPGIMEAKSTLKRDMPDVSGYYAPVYHQAEAVVNKFNDYGIEWNYSGTNSWQGRLLMPPEESSDKVAGTVRVGIGSQGVAVNPYTRTAVVTNLGDDTISLIDLDTKKQINTIHVGNRPFGPAIDYSLNVAVIPNGVDNNVSIVDLGTGTVKKVIPVGTYPTCAGADSALHIATVPNLMDNTVSVIDLKTLEVTKTISVGTMPVCMHWSINPFTKQAVVALSGENALSVIDLEKGVEIKRIPVGKAAQGSSLNPYTNIAITCNVMDNSVSVVDLTKGEVIETISVEPGPACSVIEPTRNLAIVTNAFAGKISVIDLNTMSVLDVITAGVEPGCLALDEATMTVLATSELSNDVTIVDLKQISTKTEDFSNSFFLSLKAGLNMISLPLKPQKHLMARDFMNEIGATVIIKYDTDTGRFSGFSQYSSGDGFHLEGGKGYIINVKEGKVVPFVGAAWTNEPPALAPPSELKSSAWAFVISGILADQQDGNYTATIRNLRTGDISTDLITADRFNVVFADLNRNPVVKAGDKVEIVVKDISGSVVAGPVTKQIGAGDIQRAFSDITIRFGYLKPQNSILLQNYPNPFNPETWIPFNLSKEADVSVMIYDANGRLVRNLALGRKDAGVYTDKDRAIYWDGKSDAGEDVSSGVYFYTMKAGEFSATRKMIVKK